MILTKFKKNLKSYKIFMMNVKVVKENFTRYQLNMKLKNNFYKMNWIYYKKILVY